MKVLLVILLGFVGAAVVWMLQDAPPTPPVEPTPTQSAPGTNDTRIADLETRMTNLQSELRRLSAELAAVQRVPVGAATAPMPTPAELQRTGDGMDLRWYLQQYVRSFENGGDGSEYFRLVVDAYAVELLEGICALVRAPGAALGLRASLAAILGTPRFAHSTPAVDALLALLGTNEDRLGKVALGSLDVIGDEQTGLALERLFFRLASTELKKRALAVMVRIDGPDANRALDRLFATAATSEDRALVLAALSTADPDAAIAVFGKASIAEEVVRLQAANQIGRFRGEALARFIEQWLSHEQVPAVRQALEQARARLREVQPYSAAKAVGAPDAIPENDHPNAWASQQPDGGRQWLEVGYRPARRANAVRIHEVCVAGAVVQVIVVDEAGERHQVWAGVDPTATPGVFQVTFATTAFRVKAVRIVLDTDKKPGWSEIDAVELLGPDGNAWASEASASSSYGQ